MRFYHPSKKTWKLFGHSRHLHCGLEQVLRINDVTTLNWKKIKSYFAEHEKTAEDRPYTHSEIQTLLQHSSLRNCAMILLMASAGLRVGALPLLRIKDLESIDTDGLKIYKVNVYAKSKKSSYFSFCTPETRTHIDIYLDHRRRWGERLTDDSPLFRTDLTLILVLVPTYEILG
jgi:integrase